jgi:hypothetical protein
MTHGGKLFLSMEERLLEGQQKGASLAGQEVHRF